MGDGLLALALVILPMTLSSQRPITPSHPLSPVPCSPLTMANACSILRLGSRYAKRVMWCSPTTAAGRPRRPRARPPRDGQVRGPGVEDVVERRTAGRPRRGAVGEGRLAARQPRLAARTFPAHATNRRGGTSGRQGVRRDGSSDPAADSRLDPGSRANSRRSDADVSE